MQQKVKFIFIGWIILILAVYILNLNYHFIGKETQINNKEKLVFKIDSIYKKLNEQKNHNVNESSFSILNHFNLNNILSSSINPKWKIVLFAHEYCPCTRASITEFYKLSKKYNLNPLIIYSDIENENNNRILNEINVENEFNSNKYYSNKLKIISITDENNKLTKSENIEISGFVVLIDNFNNILYTGGVTPYRAHEGKSELHFYLEKLKKKVIINTQSMKKSNSIKVLHSKVFGCEL